MAHTVSCASQINGVYKVKNAALKVLHADVQEVLKVSDSDAVEHFPREDNQVVDELANLTPQK